MPPLKKINYDFYVKEALNEKRLQNEYLRKKLLSETQDALKTLSQKIKFDEAIICGSLSRPFKFSEKSDIDIGFLGLQDGDFFTTISLLRGHLKREVDVIQLQTSNPIHKIIIKEGIKWKKRD
jgi:predicted nucleotidyltransferase